MIGGVLVKKIKKIIKPIILVVSVFVFCFSAYQLYDIFLEYKENKDEYQGLSEEVVVVPEEEKPESEPEKPKEEIPENKNWTPIDYTKIVIDFSKLKKTNSDVVAWIRFPNPAVINYPVVQGSDNDKYLKTSFQGRKNFAGTLFVDVLSEGGFTGQNTFIHGHNMKNGSMFGSLRRYKTKSFCTSNPYFYVYTPDGKVSTYQVFAVCVVESDSRSYTKSYSTDEDFMDYINYIKQKSLYKTDITVNADSQIISLSTCTGRTDSQRLLVHGVKISEIQQ